MTIDNRAWKVLVHSSIWFAPVLLPILVYVLNKDREVRSISIQALVFHLLMCVMIGISTIFSFILIGLPFLLFFGLVSFFVPVFGIFYSIQDRPFHYPLLRAVSEK